MDENVPKSRLSNTTMYIDYLNLEKRESCAQFIWNLDGFFKSKNSVVYTQKVEEFDFNLKLTKNRAFFTVTIDTNRKEPIDMLCCARSDDGYISEILPVCEVSTLLYGVTFPPNVVKSLKHGSLSDCGSIKLQFVTGAGKKHFFYHGTYNQDNSRFVEFRGRNILWQTVTRGFGIQPTEGPKMYCPRSLLASRSQFFRDYFNKQSNLYRNEMSINAPFKSLTILIYYLYSGILRIDDLPEMLDIVKMAWELNIPCLKYRCFQSLPCFINVDNVHEIKRVGIESGLPFLVEHADNFLANCKNTA